MAENPSHYDSILNAGRPASLEKTPPPGALQRESSELISPARSTTVQQMSSMVDVLRKPKGMKLNEAFLKEIDQLIDGLGEVQAFHERKKAQDPEALALHTQIRDLNRRLRAIIQGFEKKAQAGRMTRSVKIIVEHLRRRSDRLKEYLATPSDRFNRDPQEVERFVQQSRASMAGIVRPAQPSTRNDSIASGLPASKPGENRAKSRLAQTYLAQEMAHKGYEVVSKLGQGGMGTVYEVVKNEAGLDVHYAAKIVSPNSSGSSAEQVRLRFQREVRAIQKLDLVDKNGYLSKLKEVVIIETDDGPAMVVVLEKEKGPSVKLNDYAKKDGLEKLERGAFDGDKMTKSMQYLREQCEGLVDPKLIDRIWLRVSDQVMEAAAFIESEGFQHRDHKPSNLIIVDVAADIFMRLINRVAKVMHDPKYRKADRKKHELKRVFDVADQESEEVGRLVRIIDFGLCKEMNAPHTEQDDMPLDQARIDMVDDSKPSETIRMETEAGSVFGTVPFMNGADLAGIANKFRDSVAITRTIVELSGHHANSWGSGTRRIMVNKQTASEDADRRRRAEMEGITHFLKSPSDRLKKINGGKREILLTAVEYHQEFFEHVSQHYPELAEVLKKMSPLSMDGEILADLPRVDWKEARNSVHAALEGRWSPRKKVGLASLIGVAGVSLLTAVLSLNSASARSNAEAEFADERDRMSETIDTEREQRLQEEQARVAAERERLRVEREGMERQRVQAQAATQQAQIVSELSRVNVETAEAAQQVRDLITRLEAVRSTYQQIGETNPSLETAIRDAKKKLIEALVLGQMFTAYERGQVEAFNRLQTEVQQVAGTLHPDGARLVRLAPGLRYQDITTMDFQIKNRRVLSDYESFSNPLIVQARTADISSRDNFINLLREISRVRDNSHKCIALTFLLQRVSPPRVDTSLSLGANCRRFAESEWNRTIQVYVEAITNSMAYGSNLYYDSPHLVHSTEETILQNIRDFMRSLSSTYPDAQTSGEYAVMMSYNSDIRNRMAASVERSNGAYMAKLSSGLQHALNQLDSERTE